MRPANRWLILAVLCVTDLVVVIDNTVLNVAVPALTEDLAAGIADAQWGLRMAPFALSVVVLTATGLSARLVRAAGAPAAVAAGMALFAAGLAVVALAAGYPAMLLGLVLTGAGCALATRRSSRRRSGPCRPTGPGPAPASRAP